MKLRIFEKIDGTISLQVKHKQPEGDIQWEDIRVVKEDGHDYGTDLRSVFRAKNEHEWISFHGMPTCKNCGTVRRKDGQNRPCKGKVKITTRKSKNARTNTTSGD